MAMYTYSRHNTVSTNASQEPGAAGLLYCFGKPLSLNFCWEPTGNHNSTQYTFTINKDPTLLHLSQLERNLQKSRDAKEKEKRLF